MRLHWQSRHITYQLILFKIDNFINNIEIKFFMNLQDKLLLLLKTSRPALWVIAPLVFLVGLFFSGASLSTLSIIQLVLLTFPYCVFLYGINDVYDYESDQLNPRKKLVQGIKLKKKHHEFIKLVSYVMIGILIISSLITFNISNWVGMVLLLLFSYFYSVPPIRLKVLPPIDSFANGVLYFFAPFLLGFSFGGTGVEIPLKIYFVAACGMGFHVLSTITDYSVDKKVGDRTFAVAFGKRTAAVFAVVIFLLTMFFVGIQTVILNYYLIAALLVAIAILIYPNEKFSLILLKGLFVGFVVIGIIYILLIT